MYDVYAQAVSLAQNYSDWEYNSRAGSLPQLRAWAVSFGALFRYPAEIAFLTNEFSQERYSSC